MPSLRVPIALLGVALVQSCGPATRGGSPGAATTTPAQTFRAETLATRPVVEMHCSETGRRNEVATVRVRPRALSDSGRLEVTVFKNGFATGRFATVHVTAPARPAAVHVTALARQHGHLAFAFDSVHVRTQRDSLIIHVEGLEAGLNYYWRFVERAQNTMVYTRPTLVQAPTCH